MATRWGELDEILWRNKLIPSNNQVHRQVVSRVNQESVSFLDTKIVWDRDSLVTDLYTKPTDTHQYLHCCSCHPSHCKWSIAFSQALWLRRIFSRPTDYERHVKELKRHLMKRGHDGEEVQFQIEKATTNKRELLMSWEKKHEQVTPLVVTFEPWHSPLDAHSPWPLMHHQYILTTERWATETPSCCILPPPLILGTCWLERHMDKRKKLTRGIASVNNHAARHLNI